MGDGGGNQCPCIRVDALRFLPPTSSTAMIMDLNYSHLFLCCETSPVVGSYILSCGHSAQSWYLVDQFFNGLYGWARFLLIGTTSDYRYGHNLQESLKRLAIWRFSSNISYLTTLSEWPLTTTKHFFWKADLNRLFGVGRKFSLLDMDTKNWYLLGAYTTLFEHLCF